MIEKDVQKVKAIVSKINNNWYLADEELETAVAFYMEAELYLCALGPLHTLSWKEVHETKHDLIRHQRDRKTAKQKFYGR